jgi:alpha-beta hydrolase superfamily lysophospholipase
MSRAAKQESEDDLRREYDFSSMAGGVRGKDPRRFQAGVKLVLLDPEVASAFPTDRAVNDALRSVMRAAKVPKRRTGLPNERMQRTRLAQAKKPRR